MSLIYRERPDTKLPPGFRPPIGNHKARETNTDYRPALGGEDAHFVYNAVRSPRNPKKAVARALSTGSPSVPKKEDGPPPSRKRGRAVSAGPSPGSQASPTPEMPCKALREDEWPELPSNRQRVNPSTPGPRATSQNTTGAGVTQRQASQSRPHLQGRTPDCSPLPARPLCLARSARRRPLLHRVTSHPPCQMRSRPPRRAEKSRRQKLGRLARRHVAPRHTTVQSRANLRPHPRGQDYCAHKRPPI